MKQFAIRLLSLAMALTLLLSVIPALAESRKLATSPSATQIQIYNNTGASITEIYLYPNYSAKVGDARNKGWIKKQESGMISITSVEANRDCLWNMIVVFKPQNRYAFKVTWEDLDLRYYLGQTVEFTVNDDDTYNMAIVGQSEAIEFDFYNDMGYTVSEIYFYTANSSTHGQTRNNKAIPDQGSCHIKFNTVESSSNAVWYMRVTLAVNYRWYYVEFEDVDLNYYNGGTLVLTQNRDGYFEIYRLEDML